MSLPFVLPDWVPGWVPLALLVPLALYGLALLVMPFAVLGVKSRLEGLEARLDEIQGEIRALALRLPEPMRGAADFDDSYISPPPAAPARNQRGDQVGVRPPIPPASWQPEEDRAGLAAVDRRLASVRRGDEPVRPEQVRSEPRLNWPR